MNKKPAEHVDAKAAQRLVKANKARILDIRTPSEYEEGHIRGAINIDFKAPDFATRLNALDNTKGYIVHCMGGGRSTRSLPVLAKEGFEQIYHLDGGFRGWAEAGLPVEGLKNA